MLFLACEKKEGNRDSYVGILHILRGGGRLCGDIAQIGILHIFSASTHFSIVLFCHQSDCGREEAVEKTCPVGDDAVRSAVSQVVCE